MERFADRIQETTPTAGTGPLALGGAVPGFARFLSVMTLGDTCTYVIIDPVANAWETGTGTYSATNTLSRAVASSSAAGALINLAGNAGTTVSIGLTAGIMRTLTRTLGQAQVLTASATIDITKPLFIAMNSTVTAITAALPSGTYDGQTAIVFAYPAPASIQHAISGVFFGTQQTIPLYSPNIGAAMTLQWSSSLTSWLIPDFIGGMETKDLAVAATLTGAELLSVTQANFEFQAALSVITAFIRQTPAGDRTVALTSSANLVALTATDHDKVIVATGSVAGSVAVDSGVPAGFRCTLINLSSGALTYTGFTALGGGTALAASSHTTIAKAGGTVVSLSGGTSSSSGSTSPTVATSMTLAQSATSGTADTLTIAPVGGVWPTGSFTLTATLTGGAAGTLGTPTGATVSGNAITPTAGSGSVTVPFTGTANGNVVFALTNTMSLSNPASLSYTVSGVAPSTTYPTLAITGGTFDTENPSLVGPATATAAISLGAGNGKFCIEAFMSSTGSAYGSALTITDGTNTVGSAYDGGSRLIATKAPGNTTGGNGNGIGDGAWHYIVTDNSNDGNISVNTDGGTYNSFYACTFAGGTNCTFQLNIPSGVRVKWIKVSNISRFPTQISAPIPTAAPTRDANAVVIWQLTGNGSGT